MTRNILILYTGLKKKIGLSLCICFSFLLVSYLPKFSGSTNVTDGSTDHTDVDYNALLPKEHAIWYHQQCLDFKLGKNTFTLSFWPEYVDRFRG